MKRIKKWMGMGLAVMMLLQPMGYVSAEEEITIAAEEQSRQN